MTFDALVDSGADYCVFPVDYGILIGLDVEKGNLLPTHGVGGKEMLYFHNVKVIVKLGDDCYEFICQAGFSKRMNQRGVGLLGRKGFFSLFNRVIFEENKRNLILEAEDLIVSKFKHGGPLF